MNILGIDLSTSATGLCMLSKGTFAYLETEQWPGRQQTTGFIGERFYRCALIVPTGSGTLEKWESVLLPILAWAQHANRVMIEGYGFSVHMQATRALAEIGGIVRYHLRKLGQPPIEIAPTSLKKFLTGNGRADKIEMLRAVRREGLSIDDHNIADAYGLAKIGCSMIIGDCELQKHEREVLEAITTAKTKTKKRQTILKFPEQSANAELD